MQYWSNIVSTSNVKNFSSHGKIRNKKINWRPLSVFNFVLRLLISVVRNMSSSITDFFVHIASVVHSKFMFFPVSAGRKALDWYVCNLKMTRKLLQFHYI